MQVWAAMRLACTNYLGSAVRRAIAEPAFRVDQKLKMANLNLHIPHTWWCLEDLGSFVYSGQSLTHKLFFFFQHPIV
ncbi:hypothetical protein EDB87DRAFT_1614621 [Lactarius vividus]|nr:hypothetical protein EDB87DRAFT_1614621 [Lactarius vividus]